MVRGPGALRRVSGRWGAFAEPLGNVPKQSRGVDGSLMRVIYLVNPIVMASLWGNLMEKHLPLEIKFERDNYATSDSVKA